MFRATINELEWVIFKQLDVFPIDHLTELLQQISTKEAKITKKYDGCDIRESLVDKQLRLYDELIKRLGEEQESGEVQYNASRLFYAFRDLLFSVLKYTGGEYNTLSEDSLVPFLLLARGIESEAEVLSPIELNDMFGVYRKLDHHFDGFYPVVSKLKRQIDLTDPAAL